MKSLYTMVGMQYRRSNKLIHSLKKGTELELRRDPNNPADSNAIEIWYDGRHIAFIKANEAFGLAREMDDLKRSTIKGSLTFGGDRWPEVEVEL